MPTDHRLERAAAALAWAVATLPSCDDERAQRPIERACSDTQALVATRYHGAELPDKTLALTFDDGPGPRTAELSRFLKERGVAAAFFVTGRMLAGDGSDLRRLVDDGHVIGNHTQTHSDLTTLEPAEIVAELERTDRLIAPFVPDQRFMFRPPFGAYTDATFAVLQGTPMNKYVGPIDWDIGDRTDVAQAADWDCWSPVGTSVPPVLDVKTCGDLYLAEIRRKRSGIVLLHDPLFIDDDPSKGGTVDMIEYILPVLQSEGFRFVRVDEVPAIAAALPPLTKPEPAGEAPPPPPPRSEAVEPAEPAGATTTSDSTEPCPPSPQPDATKSAEAGPR